MVSRLTPYTPEEARAAAASEERQHGQNRLSVTLRRYAALMHENERLMEVCRNTHDQLLRGDSDRELLAFLAEAWEQAPRKP